MTGLTFTLFYSRELEYSIMMAMNIMVELHTLVFTLVPAVSTSIHLKRGLKVKTPSVEHSSSSSLTPAFFS